MPSPLVRHARLAPRVRFELILLTVRMERLRPWLKRNFADRELFVRGIRQRFPCDSRRPQQRIRFDGERIGHACVSAIQIDKSLIAGILRNPKPVFAWPRLKCPWATLAKSQSRQDQAIA